MAQVLTVVRKSLSRQPQVFRRAVSTMTAFQPSFDPYAYTQGRWLDRDQERRNARRLHFDFDALLDIAIKCSPGARRVTRCEKKEGGANRVFIVHLDNKSTVVARLPTRVAGPLCLTIKSEVATLKFVKEKTTVPVPRVLAWSANHEDSVGADYMILEAMPGVLLKDVWNNMTASQHIACIESIGDVYWQLCQHSFPMYGSLYLACDAPPGAVRLDETFCIGPVCAPQYWNCSIDRRKSVEHIGGYQGPWNNVEDYFADYIARAKSSLQIGMKETSTPQLERLDMLQQTLHHLLSNESVKAGSEPVLLHPDFHTRNIFVDTEDHTKITGIIEWQSAAVEPAVVFAAEDPDFAEELPDEDERSATDLTEEEQAANKRLRADVERCVLMWAVMQQPCEKLCPASHLDPLLLQVLAAPNFGWIDKDIVVESLLNSLAKKWELIGLPGQSIYKPSKAEDVVERLDEYQGKRQMQDYLSGHLRCDSDGWVPIDRWDEVLPRYRQVYSQFVGSVIETEGGASEEANVKAVEKANRMWPWDQR